MELRRIHNGKEYIVLEEDGRGGFMGIEVEVLLKPAKEVVDTTFPGTFLAWLKSERARDGCKACGWDRYLETMKTEGFPIE